MAGLDQVSKELCKNKEVLAVILKGVARKFESYTYKEIMDFIKAGSITGDAEVSPGRTNTRIHGDDKEFTFGTNPPQIVTHIWQKAFFKHALVYMGKVAGLSSHQKNLHT